MLFFCQIEEFDIGKCQIFIGDIVRYHVFDTSYHDYGLVEEPGRWLIAGFSVKL